MTTNRSIEAEKDYCTQIVHKYDRLELSGLPERRPDLHSVPLEQIFVKLQTEVEYILPDNHKSKSKSQSETIDKAGPKSSSLEAKSGEPGGDSPAQGDAPQQRFHVVKETKSVAEALHQHRRLLIVGGAGSGKTTLTLWLTLIFARNKQASLEYLGEHFKQPRLPILLELRRFAGIFAEKRKQSHVSDLAQIITEHVEQDVYFSNGAPQTIQQALREGRCILLVDGLDEIVDLNVRREFARALDGLLMRPDGDYASNLCVVTSRQHGIHNVAFYSHFQICYIKPFSEDDVEQFLIRWYETAYGIVARDIVGKLFTQIKQNDRVMALATNPLLCTIIAIVYRTNRILPDRRTELYLKCCETLLDIWERGKGIEGSGLIHGSDWQTKFELLAELAYWLHSEENRVAATEEAFIEKLAQILLNKGMQSNITLACQEARQFLQTVRERSGLLSDRGDGTFEFVHLTFQEYLAARHIAAQDYPVYLDSFMMHYLEPWWQEVHLLTMGHLGSTGDTAEKASQIILAMLRLHSPPLRPLRPTHPLSTRRLMEFAYKQSNNRIKAWIIALPLLLPFFVKHRIAGSLAKLQWQRRIFWLGGYDFVAASKAFTECSPLSVRTEVKKALRDQAFGWMVQILNDPALHLGIRDVSRDRNEFTLLGEKETSRQVKADSELYESCLPFLIGDTALVEPIVAAINTPNSDIQEVAIVTARWLELHDDRIVNAIDKLFDDPDLSMKVQKAIFEHIAFLTNDHSRIVSILLRGIALENSYAGYCAISALGELEGLAAEDIKLLHSLMLETESGSVRHAIARCMFQASSLTQDSAGTLTRALIAYSDDHLFISYGTKALGKHGRSHLFCRDDLLEILYSKADRWLRRNAAEQLGGLHDADKKIIDSLADSLKEDNDIGEATAKALASIGANNQAAIDRLVEIAGVELNDRIRHTALSALSKMSNIPTEHLQRFLEAVVLLKTPYYCYDQSKLIKSLLETSIHLVPHACQLIAEGISDAVSRCLISAFGELQDPAPCILDLLVYLINTNDQDLTSLAALQLAKIAYQSPDAMARLAFLLEPNNTPRVRIAVAYNLHRLQRIPENILQTLRYSLQSENNKIRLSVAYALLKSHNYVSEAADNVIQILLRGSGHERSIAAHHLSLITFAQPLAPVFHVLAYTLNDPISDVRLKAAESLHALWEPVRRHYYPQLADELILDQTNIPDHEKVSQACIKALTDPQSDVDVKVAAVKWFDEYAVAQEDAADALMQVVEDLSEKVQQAAVKSLGKVGIATQEVLAVLVKTLGTSDDLQDIAAESLMNLGALNFDILHALLTSRPDRVLTNWHRPRTALVSLVKQHPHYLTDLNAYLSPERDVSYRRRAAKTLGELLSLESATAALLSVAQDYDPELRGIIAESFARHDTDVPVDAIEELVRLLGDSEGRVQSAAVRALVKTRHKDASVEPRLLEVLLRGPDEQLRRSIAQELMCAEPLADKTMNTLVDFVAESADSGLQQDMLEVLHDKPWGRPHVLLLPSFIKLVLEPNLEYNEHRNLNWRLDEVLRPESDVLNALASILSRPNEHTDLRQWVARRLGKLPLSTPKTIAVLLNVAISSDDPNLQRVADKSLQSLMESSDQVVNWICEEYRNGNQESQNWIIYRFAELKRPNREATQVLQDVVERRDHHARLQAAAGLATMQIVDDNVIDILVEHVDEPSLAGESLALRSLSSTAVGSDTLLKKLLIRLLKILHQHSLSGDEFRRGVVRAIIYQSNNKPLPNDSWSTVKAQEQRFQAKRRRIWFLFFLFLFLVVVLLIIRALWFLAGNNPNSQLVRFIEILSWGFTISGALAGILLFVLRQWFPERNL